MGMKILFSDKDCVYAIVSSCSLSCSSGVLLAELQILLFCGFFFPHRKSVISILTTVTVKLKE
jgi:hypothetical protein